jgi:hypothetical protein
MRLEMNLLPDLRTDALPLIQFAGPGLVAPARPIGRCAQWPAGTLRGSVAAIIALTDF